MKAFTKKILFLLRVFMFLLTISFLGLSQEKDSSNGWVLAPATYGIVNYNETKTYSSNGITTFVNSGIPIQILEFKIFALGWEMKIPIQKIPKEISGNFFLSDEKNLDSLEIYLTIYYKNGWTYLGQKKILIKNMWNEFAWNITEVNADSITGICFSYQLRTTLIDSILAIIELKDLSFDSNLVGIISDSKQPSKFNLSQNYPNPFNPSTKINFTVPAIEHVRLVVYNSVGQEIKTLVSEEKDIGSYEVEFDASKLPSGIYFYKLQAGSFVETNKMILIK